MTEGGFFERKPINTTGLTIVIAMHAAVLTALALSKTEVIREVFPITRAKLIPLKDDPPKLKPDKPKPVPKQTFVTQPKPDLVLPKFQTTDFTKTDDPPPLPTVEGPIVQPLRVETVDPPQPVRLAAVLDGRSELQPSYPSSEQRAGTEGSVTVRVLVGTDGRVKAVEKVRAASEGFFRSTERQARLHWRFKPATLDGRPVESWQVMTVHFQLRA